MTLQEKRFGRIHSPVVEKNNNSYMIGDFIVKKTLFCALMAGAILWAISPGHQTPHALSGTAFAQQIADNGANTNYSQIGFALMKENIGFISIGISDSDTLKILGNPEQKSDTRIWGADGREHQRWYYQTKGIELDMIGKESNQAVNMIILKSPCDYKTQRGIQIGSSNIEVQSAYRNEINPHGSSSSSTIVAGTIYGGIIFNLKDNIVTSIFIGAAAE